MTASTGNESTWPVVLGPLLARESLSADSARWAMDQIMSGDATDAQIAGFAVALRAKGETAEEMSGLVAAMLARAHRFEAPGPAVDVVGTGGDGSNTANLTWDGEHIRGTATFGATHAGPPNMVHGGVVALLFDEVLGCANMCAGVGGFTGTLTIRYEKPTPLNGELELESHIDTVEGRKIRTTGTITHDGQVTARAEGIFIRVSM